MEMIFGGILGAIAGALLLYVYSFVISFGYYKGKSEALKGEKK